MTTMNLQRPLGAPTGGLSLTAKLSIAATLLCALCVVSTSSVLGVRTATVAREQADQAATLAAREAASQVAAEIGRSFSAVKTMADTMRGMKVVA